MFDIPIFVRIMEYVSDRVMWSEFMIACLKLLIIVVASRLVIKILKKSIQHITEERETNPLRLDRRRTRTMGKLVSNIVVTTINFVAFLLIVSLLGFDILPLLAGAGVVGLAIGFGAQNLVKDIITGFFIIFEDQFAVGDVIQTGDVKGNVEEIGLRTTIIKTWNGEVHIIPNGSIDKVINFSIHNSVGVVDISIAYEADIDQALSVIKQTANLLYENTADMVKEPNVLGVQSLGDSEVVLRLTFECVPNTHLSIGRQLNQNIKNALDAQNIEIPYPRLVTYHRTEKGE